MNISKWFVFGVFTISLSACSAVGGQSSSEKYTPQCDTSGLSKVTVEDYVRVGMSIPEFVCVARRYNRNPNFAFCRDSESKGVYFCFEKGGKAYYARSIGCETIDEIKVVDSKKLTYDELMAEFPLQEWERDKLDRTSKCISHAIPNMNLDGILKFGAHTASRCYLAKMYESPSPHCYSAIPVYDNDKVCGVLTFSSTVNSTTTGIMNYFDTNYESEPALVMQLQIDNERSLFWMPPFEVDEGYSAKECYSDARNPVDTDIERKAYEAVSSGNFAKLSAFGMVPFYGERMYATVGDCEIVGKAVGRPVSDSSFHVFYEIGDVEARHRRFLRKRDFSFYRDGISRDFLIEALGYPNANWPEDYEGRDISLIADSACGYEQRVFAYPVYSDCVEKPTNEDIVAIAVIHFQDREGYQYVSSGIEFRDSFYEWNLPRY